MKKLKTDEWNPQDTRMPLHIEISVGILYLDH